MGTARRRANRSLSVARHQVAAKGSSSENSGGSILAVIGSDSRLFELLVLVHPFRDLLVQVSAQDLLVVQRKPLEHARLEHGLRGLERVGVLEPVLLEEI